MEKYKLINDKKIFDLVTIGQAYHWFDQIKLLTYIDEILTDDGVLIITGYKKQHFKENDLLYGLFEEFIQKLTPYFECDVYNNDNAYIKSMENFRKYYKTVEVKHFEEESVISLDKLIEFVKSWSAYYNYKNTHSKEEGYIDPCETLKLKCGEVLQNANFDSREIKFYNFYFMLIMKK